MPLEVTFTVLKPILELTFKDVARGPSFDTMTFLFVEDPVAYVLYVVFVGVRTLAVALVLVPFTIVDFLVSCDKTAHTVASVGLPVALVLATVGPGLLASAFLLTILIFFT